MSVAICFLVINEVRELPTLSIRSVQEQTNTPIFVGYFRERDISRLPRHDQITYIKIGKLPEDEESNYQNFGTDAFYDAVSKKWELISKVLKLGYEFVIYNDIDLVWVRDAGLEITKTFGSNRGIQVLVQSLTECPSEPSLCMGFLALRNSEFTVNFIKECAKKNLASRTRSEMIGDDEIITEMYKNLNFDSRIRELPQTTFPVGYSIKLFKGFSPMPGIAQASPYIFHANYVVGETNKRILLRLFLGHKRLMKLGFKRDYLLSVIFALKWIKTSYSKIIH
jgi:hypothetical protein